MYLCKYETFDDVAAKLPHFIDEIYNRRRFHSTLVYWLPNDFKKQLIYQQPEEVSLEALLTLPVRTEGFTP